MCATAPLPPSPSLLGLLETASDHGMIGGRLADHVRHAQAFAAAWPHPAPPTRLVDLGSGGGLPALVLAEIWPATTLLLTETREKRSDWLRQAIRVLDLQDRAEVWAGDVQRAAQGEYRGWAQLVTARAFGAPAIAAECAAGLLGAFGHIVVSEPPAERRRWDDAGLEQLGLRLDAEVMRPYRFIRLTRSGPTSDQFPRPRRTMARRPLWTAPTDDHCTDDPGT